MRISTFLLLFFLVSQSLLAQTPTITCGVNDSVLPDSIVKAMQMAPFWLKQKQARKSAEEFYVCRIAVEIDSDTYEAFGKDSSYIKHEVIKMIEKVSKIYEAEIRTQLVVTLINIRKDPKTDPYRGVTNIYSLLSTLATSKLNSPFKEASFDKVVYLFTKSVYGAGGVASYSGYCVAPLSTVYTIAHEIGHTFGSPHTHNCSWPGGMIDYCSTDDGGCNKPLAMELIRGTIMSYCGAELTFHPLCQALMYEHAKNRFSKIADISNTPPVLSSVQDGKPYLVFNPVVFAESYQYEIAQSAGFTKNLVSDTTSLNEIYFNDFKKNNTYYIRVKAKNRLGNSAWSNVISVYIPNNILTTPVLLNPKNNVQSISPNQEITFFVEPVAGAKNYEISLSTYPEIDWYVSKTKIFTATKNEYSLKPSEEYLGNLIFAWRVRAVNDSTASSWSEPRKVIFVAGEYEISFPFGNINNMPLSFPFTFSTNGLTYNSKVTISKNQDLSNPIFEKTFTQGKYNIYQKNVLLENLQPNTQYYIKLETINPNKELELPNGVFKSLTKTFRTGSEYFPSQLKIYTENNLPNMGSAFSNILPSSTNVFKYSEAGLVKIKADSLKVEVFTHQKTNGIIGNFIDAMDVDSLGNVHVILRLAKYGESGEMVFALRQFDGKTMELISSKEFVLNNAINTVRYYNANNNIISDGRKIGRIVNGKVEVFFTFDDKYSFDKMEANSSYIWLYYYNNATQKNELKEYNFKTQTTKFFPNEAFTQNINKLKLDKKGNLWASHRDGISKYDGSNWTTYTLNNPSSDHIGIFNFDSQNSLYAHTYQYFTTENNKLIRLKNDAWQELIAIPNINANEMIVDNLGKVWLNNQGGLVRFDPCKEISKPSIESKAKRILYGETLSLEAKGCTNVVWNWKNAEEQVYNKLINGNNKIIASPKSTTTYYARCYDDGCSSTETSFDLSVIPNLYVNKVDKSTICMNDSIAISPLVQGGSGNDTYSAVLTSSASKNVYPLTLSNQKNTFILKPTASMPSGKYWLKLMNINLGIASKDSIEITLNTLPKVEITGSNNICEAQYVRLLATTITNNSIAYYLWEDGEKIITGNNSNSLTIGSAGIYKLRVIDKNQCSANAKPFDVNLNKSPVIKVEVPDSFCTGQKVTLKASGSEGTAPYQYEWGGNNLPANTKDSTLKIAMGGLYYATVIDAKGCRTMGKPLLISQYDYPVVKLSKEGSTDLLPNSEVIFTVVKDTVLRNYQWNKDHKAIKGANSNVYKASQAGIYTVSVTNNGCTTVSDSIVVNLITSNEPTDYSDNLIVKAFPNPNDGYFTIEFISTDTKATEFTIFDIEGKVVLRKSIRAIGKHSEILNISEKPSGEYFLMIQKENSRKTIKLNKR